MRTAFVSTYPPRHCGVATFTLHLAAAVGGREIVALHAEDLPSPYPLEVHHRLRVSEPDDFARTAQGMRSCADIVSIQHAFGIWGEPDGDGVLDFARALAIPSVTTLHSIPAAPTPAQHRVLAELVASAAATVVMSRAAEASIVATYGADPGRVEVIAHGIPDLPLVDADAIKPAVGMAGRDVLLSFGLLAPGKGIELALAALPAIVAERPTTTYVVLGANHPRLPEGEGEAYRTSLSDLAASLGVSAHVQFIDRFVGRVELTRWLEAADVIVAPYTDLGKSVAGTLSYAMGAGRPVVATPFAHATELLADGRGVLLPAVTADALATAVVGLLVDRDARIAMGRLAHEHSRPMTWWNVGAQYRTLLGRLVATPMPARRQPGMFARPA